MGNAATYDRTLEKLGRLAVRAANDLEIALALGDAQKADSLDRLVREKLGDTRWSVERLATKGDVDARFALGMFYARNLLAARNREKACEAFVGTAGREHIAGTYQAALCLLKSDPEHAAEWMQRAAVAGHPAAQEAVGRACLERKPAPDLECAKRYVGNAAASGRPSAQSLLGWMYASGAGVPKDLPRAAELYLEAARRGDVAAQNNLGEMYEKGVSLTKNARLAAAWYRQAAQAGFAPAQFNLGRMYAIGAGVERDVANGRNWLQKANDQGLAEAGDLLRWLDQQGAVAGKRREQR